MDSTIPDLNRYLQLCFKELLAANWLNDIRHKIINDEYLAKVRTILLFLNLYFFIVNDTI